MHIYIILQMTYIKVIAYLKKSTHITHTHTHMLACTRVCVYVY